MYPSRGRGQGRGRGRGRNQNYSAEYPELGGWVTPKSKKNSSTGASTSAKDILLSDPSEAYIRNTIVEEIVLYVEEPDLKYVTDPWEIRDRYLQHQAFLPHFDQYRYIYEQMLLNTSSVEITHHNVIDGNSKSPIKFSKAIIRKVITPPQWGTSLNQCRDLKFHNQNHNLQYNYWDYQKAFSHTFYYQNPVKSHSWFFKCDPPIAQYTLPTWFYVWWDTFGPNIDILPEKVLTECQNWMSVFQTMPGRQNFAMTKMVTLFFIFFGIPWIWKWDFICDTKHRPCLKRIFFYKWWDRTDQAKLVEAIKTHMKALIDSRPKPVVENPFSKIMNTFKQQFPKASTEEILQKTMDFMKDQLLEANHITDDDQSMASEHILAGESQLPDDDDDDDCTVVEYWDTITEVMIQKMAKGKAKTP